MVVQTPVQRAVDTAALLQPAAMLRLALPCGIVRLHFATPALGTMFVPAFLPAEPGAETGADPGAETGDVWDIFVTAGDQGTAAPALVPPDPGGEMILNADAAAFGLWMGRHTPTLYAVDLLRRRALYWVARLASVPAWERARPFLPIFQAMLDATPWIAVHAAAIAWQGRAVLLAGAGHAGKTSLALAGLCAGWRFAGDDFVLLRTGTAPEVAPLYATARLRDDMLPQFRALEAARREISGDDGERRHELSFGRMADAGEIGGAPLAAVFLLDRRGAATPQFAPVSRTAVLAALAASTATAAPGNGAARTAKLMQALTGQRPQRFDPGGGFAQALAALAAAVA